MIEGGFQYEKYLHYIFDEFRIHGEWFNLEEPLLSFINSLDTTLLCNWNEQVNNESCICGRRKSQLIQHSFGIFSYSCMSCLMQKDGRIAKLIKRPKIIRPKVLKICLNCNDEFYKLWRGKCHSCYEFWRRNGYERPQELCHYDKIVVHTCINCGKLENMKMSMFVLRAIRCKKCNSYFQKMKKDKPRKDNDI